MSIIQMPLAGAGELPVLIEESLEIVLGSSSSFPLPASSSTGDTIIVLAVNENAKTPPTIPNFTRHIDKQNGSAFSGVVQAGQTEVSFSGITSSHRLGLGIWVFRENMSVLAVDVSTTIASRTFSGTRNVEGYTCSLAIDDDGTPPGNVPTLRTLTSEGVRAVTAGLNQPANSFPSSSWSNASGFKTVWMHLDRS